MVSKRLVTVTAVLLPLIGLLIIPFAVVYGLAGEGWMSLANGIGLLTAAVLLLGAGAGILWKLIQLAASRARTQLFCGDYAGALRWARLMGPTGRLYRATILTLAGRLTEAEEIHRGRSEDARTPAKRAAALASLGEVLTLQGRYAEARACLDEAGAPKELADWYLEQGLDPRAALALTEEALRAQGGEANPFRMMSRAWAMAQLSQQEEARSAIGEALGVANAAYLPGMAEIHLNAGRAYAAISDGESARRHFEEAARLDSKGLRGGMARTLLQRS